MKNLARFFVVFAALLFSLAGCDNQKPPPVSPDQQAKQQEGQKQLMKAYEEDPLLKKPGQGR